MIANRSSPTPETTAWLNAFLASLWLIINLSIFTAVSNMLEDALQASLPKFIHGVRIAYSFSAVLSLPLPDVVAFNTTYMPNVQATPNRWLRLGSPSSTSGNSNRFYQAGADTFAIMSRRLSRGSHARNFCIPPLRNAGFIGSFVRYESIIYTAVVSDVEYWRLRVRGSHFYSRDFLSATTSQSTGVRFAAPSTSGSKRRRDEVEEEEEEVEGRSSRRQRTDGAHVAPAPSESREDLRVTKLGHVWIPTRRKGGVVMVDKTTGFRATRPGRISTSAVHCPTEEQGGNPAQLTPCIPITKQVRQSRGCVADLLLCGSRAKGDLDRGAASRDKAGIQHSSLLASPSTLFHLSLPPSKDTLHAQWRRALSDYDQLPTHMETFEEFREQVIDAAVEVLRLPQNKASELTWYRVGPSFDNE
ncbi:hypothetical protein BDZ89DRAFT_1045542 [Hymenopellis radicata]|nr:hypothetical protein BDZ89DRAFT_1045542 [Hymenopellis radicata]